MFNGIIFNTGKIKKIQKAKKGINLIINSKIRINPQKEIGSSICCSGACLTLIAYKNKALSFYVSPETSNKTNFSKLRKNDVVNLEKSLKFGNRISGHFIQGHIDTTAYVVNIKVLGSSWLIRFSVSKKYIKYLIYKGSIAINGVSLTVSKTYKNGFQVAVIPHSLKLTNLIKLKKNDLANIEFDILLKYIKNN